jgi:hypothetical protein
MRVLKTAGLAAFAVLAASPSLAQYASDPYDSSTYENTAPATNNAQSYRDYRRALSAYDAARNTAARQRDAYDRDSADYRANRRAYERRLREYYRARDAYDADFGPGAYEIYYGPPPAPPWD